MGEVDYPLPLLRTDVCSGRNPVRRVDEEEYEDFAVTGLLWINELERLDLVLVEVGERDAAIALSDHVPDFLYTW